MRNSAVVPLREGMVCEKRLRQAPKTGHGGKKPIDSPGHNDTHVADLVQPMPDHTSVLGHLVAVQKAMDGSKGSWGANW